MIKENNSYKREGRKMDTVKLKKYIEENMPTDTVREVLYGQLKEYTDVFLLGRSILGRDIHCYKIGSGERNVLYVAAHHGAEYITASVLFEFCLFLSEKVTRHGGYCGIRSEFLLQKFTFWCIPCLNPDGVMLACGGGLDNPLSERQLRMNGQSTDFKRWQANARGVDLNHNYDYGFSRYKEIEREREISAGRSLYSGEYPESEPETRSLAGLVRVIRPHLIISLHSQGEEVYYAPHTEACLRLANSVAHRLSYKTCIPSDTAAYGGLSDYAGHILGIPSLTLEVGRGENPLSYSSLPRITDRVLPLLYSAPTLL